MKFFKDNYRILEIEQKDIEEAHKRLNEKKDLQTINEENDFQGQLGEIGTEFLFKSIEKIHGKKCEEGITKKEIGILDGKTITETVTPLFSPNVTNKSNSDNQSKGIYEHKSDNDLRNKDSGEIAKLQYETKTKKCINKHFFDMFINNPDMLFSIFRDVSGNKFNQLIGDREVGFTLVWGVLYENRKPTKMYCYFLSNFEIRYMLKPRGLFLPLSLPKTDVEELDYILKRNNGYKSAFHPSNKEIIDIAKSNLDKTRQLIPKKSDFTLSRDFMDYQTNKLWDQLKIRLVLNKLRSYIFKGELLYLEEPFYRISLEWQKTEYVSREKTIDFLDEENMKVIKKDLTLPINKRVGLKFKPENQINLKGTRERITPDTHLVYELQKIYPYHKLNELFQK